MKYEVKESSGNLMMEKSFSFALRGRVSEPIRRKAEAPSHPRIFRQRFPLHTRKHGRHLTGCVFSSPQNTSRNGSLTVFTQIVKN